MNMPGFTAEAALYDSVEHYRLAVDGAGSMAAEVVIPQQGSFPEWAQPFGETAGNLSCLTDCWQERRECRADCSGGRLRRFFCRRRCDVRALRCGWRCVRSGNGGGGPGGGRGFPNGHLHLN